MARVTGLGVFIKAKDPKALAAWYRTVLGVEMDENWCGVAFLPKTMAEQAKAAQVFSFFKADTDHMKPSTREFMLNLCVDDIDGMLARCAEHGVNPLWRDDSDEYGRFAHILDPDGTKIELWQPGA